VSALHTAVTPLVLVRVAVVKADEIHSVADNAAASATIHTWKQSSRSQSVGRPSNMPYARAVFGACRRRSPQRGGATLEADMCAITLSDLLLLLSQLRPRSENSCRRRRRKTRGGRRTRAPGPSTSGQITGASPHHFRTRHFCRCRSIIMYSFEEVDVQWYL
jgi:hypothetical protein